MAYHDLLSKSDQAMAAYIRSQAGSAANASVYEAKNSTDKNVPCTVCFSRTATQEPAYSGNYLVKAQIDVKTSPCVDVNVSPDTPKDNSESRVSATFDLFHLTDDDSNGAALALALTNAARSAGVRDFSVTDVVVGEVEAGSTEKGDVWIDTLYLEVYCCPSDEV